MKRRNIALSILMLMSLLITACEIPFNFASFSANSTEQSSSIDDTSSSSSDSTSESSSGSSSSGSSSSSSSSALEPNYVSFDVFAFNDTHGNVKDTYGEGLGISKTATAIKELLIETLNSLKIFVESSKTFSFVTFIESLAIILIIEV